MSHSAAHAASSAHGYILLHLINTGDAAAAAAEILGRNQPDVLDADPVSDSVLVYVEPKATAHNSTPEKRAAHARLEALEGIFVKLKNGPGGPPFFDLSSHW